MIENNEISYIFEAFRALYFYIKAAINQWKIFMLKSVKQWFISRLFCTLVYKRTKVKLLKNVTH